MPGSKKRGKKSAKKLYDKVEFTERQHEDFQQAGIYLERHDGAGKLLVARSIFEIKGKHGRREQVAEAIAKYVLRISSLKDEQDPVVVPQILHKASNGEDGKSIVYFTSEQLRQNNLEIVTMMIMKMVDYALEFANSLPQPKRS